MRRHERTPLLFWQFYEVLRWQWQRAAAATAAAAAAANGSSSSAAATAAAAAAAAASPSAASSSSSVPSLSHDHACLVSSADDLCPYWERMLFSMRVLPVSPQRIDFVDLLALRPLLRRISSSSDATTDGDDSGEAALLNEREMAAARAETRPGDEQVPVFASVEPPPMPALPTALRLLAASNSSSSSRSDLLPASGALSGVPSGIVTTGVVDLLYAHVSSSVLCVLHSQWRKQRRFPSKPVGALFLRIDDEAAATQRGVGKSTSQAKGEEEALEEGHPEEVNESRAASLVPGTSIHALALASLRAQRLRATEEWLSADELAVQIRNGATTPDSTTQQPHAQERLPLPGRYLRVDEQQLRDWCQRQDERESLQITILAAAQANSQKKS